jgi:hypothetical protein
MIHQLHKWFEHIQAPRPELGNLAICPFAKKAVVLKQYRVSECTLDNIGEYVNNCDVVEYKVCIFYLSNYTEYKIEDLESRTKELNARFVQQDKVVLDNDPRSPLVIEGITTTFPECYLWIVQSLSDLTNKTAILKNTSYYSYWTEQQLDEVVNWRNSNKAI